MDTFLVTGAGFLGAYVAVQLLNKGRGVVLLDSVLPQKDSETFWLLHRHPAQPQLIKGDITDLASMLRIASAYQVKGIVHTAALTDVQILADAPTVALRVNTLGSVNVLETARSLKLERVVMASSIAVYAPVRYEPMDEDHPVLSPNAGPALTSYSASKVAAECFGMHYWAQYGVGFAAFRFSGIYGFGMRYPLYVKPVVDAVIADQALNLGPVGDTARDLIYVEDAANAMVTALEVQEGRLRSRIFNCGVGKMTRVDEIVKTVRQLEPDSRLRVDPGMTEQEAVIQRSRGRLSMERAEIQLGFKPRYSLEQGLKSYLALQRAYMAKAD